MNKHWEKLETELLPLAQDIEEAETIIQFFTAKSTPFRLCAASLEASMVLCSASD